ncbi:MAG: hypothetical protein HYT87_13110 [Nitrospirae bacterium]|nr:hypothetical protein [Nitrospirota bacterium]
MSTDADMTSEPERTPTDATNKPDLRESVILMENITIESEGTDGKGYEKLIRGGETVGYLLRLRSGWGLRHYSDKGGWRLETNPAKALQIIRGERTPKKHPATTLARAPGQTE